MKQTTTSRHCRRGHGERQPPVRPHRIRACVSSVWQKLLPSFIATALDEFVLHDAPNPLLRGLGKLLGARSHSMPRGEHGCAVRWITGPDLRQIRQVLSTRPDLIPPDIASELSRLQDRVPPFPAEDVRRVLEAAYGRPGRAGVRQLRLATVASASVAQVHFGSIQLKGG